MQKHELTSNQYYGGLNRRFEKRSRLLRKLGFEYKRSEELGMAYFVRKTFRHKRSVLTAAEVTHADNRAFVDAVRFSK